VILSHIFPNTLPPLAVQTTLAIAFAILEAAALGFLGLGAQPPVPEWGAMLADSYKFFTSGAWWAFFFPGSRSCCRCSGSTSWVTRCGTPSILGCGFNPIPK